MRKMLVCAALAGAAAGSSAGEVEDALRRMIVAAVQSGARPRTYVDVFGRRMKGIVKSADAGGFTADVLGHEVETAWSALSATTLLRLARKCAGDDAEAQMLIARYALKNDLAEEAAELARRAAELDPSFKEEALEMARALHPEKPVRPVYIPPPKRPPREEKRKKFDAVWVHASATSAVVYWRLGEISDSARSYVEYDADLTYGRRTQTTRRPRWAQFHRITGLQTGAAYHYRMVVIEDGRETRSADATFTTGMPPGARALPGGLAGPPYVLSTRGVYVLTRDITAPGTAFEIAAPDVTLDLDGHTVVFGDDTDEQAHGVLIRNEGRATVSNGEIVQGRRSKRYSSAVESRWRARPTEIFGISTDVHLPCAYPVRMFGRCADTRIHHNHLYSRVTELESRHYPGNDLLRLDIGGDNVEIFDNLLTDGCHVGMRLSGGKEGPAPKNVEIHHNDIRHHQQYVNGYALASSCPGMDIHHNKVTSVGRTVHLTAEGIRLHDNHFDTKGHWHLSDMPAKSRPWKTRRVELHGIKFEGRGVKNCKVYGNYMRITQKLPVDSGGVGAPEDKIENGVYVRSKVTSIGAGRLQDSTQNWERDRWKGYHVRYSDLAPPALITGNDSKTLFGKFTAPAAEEYAIYARWDYVPATPLNIACYDPNAGNEVYENTFVALTEYRRTRHGGYGDSGRWASAIFLVGMKSGPAEEGNYSIYIHDNRFLSNDLFVSSGGPVNMTVRVERNTFVLAADPPPTAGHAPYRGIGAALTRAIRAGGNVFQGMGP